VLSGVSKRVEAELCKRMLHFVRRHRRKIFSLTMEELQDFVNLMKTDNDAVDAALDIFDQRITMIKEVRYSEALRTAVDEQRELLKRVQVVLAKDKHDSIDFSELLGWTDEPQLDNLTSTLRLSPLHIPVTMCATMFNSIMHAFQASKVLYDKKYDGCDEKDITDEQETRMKAFATPALNTVNAWGGASGSIRLDIQRWDADKTSIMRRLMVEACKQKSEVKSSLLRTTGDIYEDTLPDNFWGHCKGQGQNTAGDLWKDIRDTETFDSSESLVPERKRVRGSSSS